MAKKSNIQRLQNGHRIKKDFRKERSCLGAGFEEYPVGGRKALQGLRCYRLVESYEYKR